MQVYRVPKLLTQKASVVQQGDMLGGEVGKGGLVGAGGLVGMGEG